MELTKFSVWDFDEFNADVSTHIRFIERDNYIYRRYGLESCCVSMPLSVISDSDKTTFLTSFVLFIGHKLTDLRKLANNDQNNEIIIRVII